MAIGSGGFIPKSNKLLHDFFSDAEVAAKSGIYKAVGESICRRLNEDGPLIESLKKELGSYSEIGRYSCPISSGITLIEIMVHEGIHQGLQDHLWLHYYYFFTRDILNQMKIQPEVDFEDEFPTRFHYLLYRMVSISTEWIEQCSRIEDKEIPKCTRDKKFFDKYFISKQATKVLGNMLEILIQSEKISDKFKVYLLEIIVRCHVNISHIDDLNEVSSSMLKSVIIGVNSSHEQQYLHRLAHTFQNIDHVLRFEASSFSDFLKAKLKL